MKALRIATPLTAALCYAVTARAQTRPIGAYDVYQACRHPAAFPKDSFEVRGNRSPSWGSVPTPSGRNEKLSYLCNSINLRVPGMNWRQAAVSWAAQALGRKLPQADSIRAFADDAESALYKWVQDSPEALAGGDVQQLALPRIPFRVSSAEILPEDSGAVRRMAEVLAEHLTHYPSDVITILGQADPTGRSRARNVALATERAKNLLAAIMRYDDGTIGRNITRIRTAARVVDEDVIADRIGEGSVVGGTSAVSRADAEIGARAGELLKARTPEFHVESPAGISNPRLHSGDILSDASAEGTTRSDGSGGRTGSIAIAVVDVVGEVAAEQVQIYLVEEVTRNICGHGDTSDPAHVVVYRRLLPSTCALFGNVAANRLFRPTLGSLRSAVRQDVDALMPRLVSTAVSSQFRNAADAHRSEALFAIALAEYLTAVAGGEDALVAAAHIPERVQGLLPAGAWDVAKTDEIAMVLRQAAPFIGLYREARTRIRGGVDARALKDQVFTLSVRAMLVNSGDATVWTELKDGNQQANLTQLLETVPSMLDAASRLEAAYTAYQDVRGASTEERLALAANVLSGSADLFLSVLPETMKSVDLAKLQTLAIPVREMTTALVRRDFRAALVSALVVARNVVPLGVNQPGADCTLPNGLRCPGQVDLDKRQMRVATFAAEFANAQDQNAMNQALRHFVSEGDGYRSKREGDPRSFFTVNAYLGLTAAREFGYEDGTSTYYQGGFYLPVGIEWVYRVQSFPLLHSFSAFLQVVDLGAFAAARYNNSSVDQPDPKLMDVLAPGLFLVSSLGNSPFSVGVGGSVAPRAQVVSAETAGERDRISGAFRLSVFMAVDVPLFP